VIGFELGCAMFYLNGDYVDEESAKIPVLDLGLIRGYGVFDYLRTYAGRPFHLWDHLLRLKHSAEHIGMRVPLSLEKIEDIVEILLKRNGYSEAGIKIILTGGVSPDQITPVEQGSLFILVHRLNPFPRELYTNGIKATTTSLQRSLPTSKTLQYLPAIVALKQGRSQNAQEALYLNQKGEILEGTTSNFFAFTKKGALVTLASEEIIFGITREIVLNLSKEHFPVELRPVVYEELEELEEAFLTSSNKEVLPLTQIDHLSIGSGSVGERTQRLMHLFTVYSQQESWPPLRIARYC
jgi:branched-chain amino acid aminotransferase